MWVFVIKATECGPLLMHKEIISFWLSRSFSLARTWKTFHDSFSYIFFTFKFTSRILSLYHSITRYTRIEFFYVFLLHTAEKSQEIDNFFIYCHFIHSFTLCSRTLFLWHFFLTIFHPLMINDKPRNYFMLLSSFSLFRCCCDLRGMFILLRHWRLISWAILTLCFSLFSFSFY